MFLPVALHSDAAALAELRLLLAGDAPEENEELQSEAEPRAAASRSGRGVFEDSGLST